jgi:sugar fermentation stimulation protein A
MDFPAPLVPVTLLRRYKRFLADVVLEDGSELTAHCPNPGAMLGLNTPGLPAWLSVSDNPKRKLSHTLELLEADGGLVGINTLLPNRLVAEALEAGTIPELAGYASVRQEVKYGKASRVDFLLEDPARGRCWLEVKNDPSNLMRDQNPVQRLWLEVKNCHLMRTKGLAEFPDCIAARASKHLTELENMVRSGDRAMILFVIQRNDCDTFSACSDLDPTFARRLREASDLGVEVMAYACDVRIDGIEISRKILCK